MGYLYGVCVYKTILYRMNFDEQFEQQFKPPAHGFQIIRKQKRQRVNAQTYPKIMEMHGEFNRTVKQTAPQAHFFNRENQNCVYKFVSPHDIDFVQKQIQKTPIANFDMNKNNCVDKYRDAIEPVTRKYEEDFMCEPTGDQRPCCMEEACEGRCIPQSPEKIILREFLLPSQLKLYEETKRYPIERSPCILCKRLQIARLVVSARAAGTGMKDDCLVQDYYNFVNIPGEYDLKDCLLSKRTVWEGLVSPVVLHVRNAYKFELKNGKKTFTQWKIPFLTRLPGSSSGTTLSATQTY